MVWWFTATTVAPVILFVLLVIISIVGSFLGYYINAISSYNTSMEYWCYNDYSCQNLCTKTDHDSYSDCYENDKNQGLAKCLFGPDSNLMNPKKDDSGNVICPTSLNETKNCLNSCALGINDLETGVEPYCCCQESEGKICLGAGSSQCSKNPNS